MIVGFYLGKLQIRVQDPFMASGFHRLPQVALSCKCLRKCMRCVRAVAISPTRARTTRGEAPGRPRSRVLESNSDHFLSELPVFVTFYMCFA